MHHPLHTSKGSHGRTEQLEDLGDIFERTGVKIVFQGHNHFYERLNPVNGVHYITMEHVAGGDRVELGVVVEEDQHGVRRGHRAHHGQPKVLATGAVAQEQEQLVARDDDRDRGDRGVTDRNGLDGLQLRH